MKKLNRKLMSVGAALVVATGLGVGSATTASATVQSLSTAGWYGSVYKVHRIWFDQNGRYLVNQSNYDTQNGGNTYVMLQNVKIQVWSGGRYYVVDGYHDWVASTGWTIRFTDNVYKNGVFVKQVFSEIRK